MPSVCLRVKPDTKARLDEMKIHDRESYDEVIERLLDSCIDEEPLTAEEIEGMEEALAELKQSKFATHSDVKKELGLS